MNGIQPLNFRRGKVFDGGGSYDRPPFFMNDQLRRANWKDRILFRLGRRRAFVIDGDSMLPALKNGEKVLIRHGANFQIGDIVLARHPYKSSVTIVKRIADIDPDGSIILSGDNLAESTDSRTFGTVSIELIIGRVICRLS